MIYILHVNMTSSHYDLITSLFIQYTKIYTYETNYNIINYIGYVSLRL